MIITINTKEDSHEEIKRVIMMLQHLLGDHSTFTNRNIFEDSSPSLDSSQPTSAFGAMFGSENTPLTDSSSAEIKEKKDDEETPEVIVYDY